MHVPGEAIRIHFSDKEVGTVDALHGNIHGTSFHIFCMKEPDYVAMIMSTHSALNEVDDHATRRTFENQAGEQETKNLKYTEPFSLHYRYRHQIDDHNNRRHSPISLEETWAPKRWENRVFAFLIAVTEVNAYRMRVYLKPGYTSPHLKFRRALVMKCINNPYLDSAPLPHQLNMLL